MSGIFVDLEKAFDTVDHNILFKKLNHYGIRGIALSLFPSYLSNRHQFVSISGIISTTVHMKHGVPQGSVLGYKLYINFTRKFIFNDKIENIFIDILFPKTKPFTVGIFYRPPDKSKFLENISDDFSKLHTENNDIFVLGDININLFKNGKYMSGSYKNDVTATCPLFNKYQEFLSNFGLKQLITSPTRITCNTTSLIDHVLTNSENKVFKVVS